jgi:hypothetical protein
LIGIALEEAQCHQATQAMSYDVSRRARSVMYEPIECVKHRLQRFETSSIRKKQRIQSVLTGKSLAEPMGFAARHPQPVDKDDDRRVIHADPRAES